MPEATTSAAGRERGGGGMRGLCHCELCARSVASCVRGAEGGLLRAGGYSRQHAAQKCRNRWQGPDGAAPATGPEGRPLEQVAEAQLNVAPRVVLAGHAAERRV